MAEKKESETREATTKEVAAKPSRGGKFRFFFFMILAGALVPICLPTLLVCAGLLPTLVVLITDTDRQKSSTITIGFMNLAGVAPFIIDLWRQGQTMDIAVHILSQPNTWLVMLGAAGLGKLLLYAVPPAMAALTLSSMESRLLMLKEGLEQLKAVWGPDVATAVPLDQIRKREEK